jgi:PAS domain S-box-containing protein
MVSVKKRNEKKNHQKGDRELSLAEETFNKSEQHTRALIEAIPDMIFRLDKHKVFTYYKADKKDLYLQPEMFIGKRVDDVMPAWFTKLVIEKIEHALGSNKIEVFEYELPDAESQLSHYECRLSSLPDNEIIAIVRNITERKRTEEELNAAVRFNTNLIESMQDGFSVLDINGVHIMVNDAMCKITGYSLNELVGTGPPHLYWSPENYNAFESALNQSSNQDAANFELIFKNKNGKRFPVIVSSVIIRNEKGEAINYAATVKDITERKKAEEALRVSENKYRRLHESMRDGFVFVNMEGRILEFNDHYQNMLGYNSDELPGLTYIELTPERWHAFEQDIVEKQVLTRGYSDIYVKEYIKKSGETFPVEFRTVLIKNEAGENTGMWAIVRDVTERKETEDALRKSENRLSQLNATKDKFFSIIAHDLKSPFHSIIGFSEILKNDARNIDINAIESYASIIHDSATQTLRLLENLLDWARMQQETFAFTPKILVLNELVKDVFIHVEDHVRRKNIGLHNHIQKIIILKADENMLKAIFRNLISNAVKFTKSGGSVNIAAQTLENEIEISVADDGIGISNENMNKLFSIDSNFTMRGTEQEKGTGLGLLLCKEFVEKHCGKIWVESKEEKGSTFYFTIPIDANV